MLYSIKKISELCKTLKKYCKKVCHKSCMKGKSLYLCNRFREGEPLKMTDWKSWGYGRECRCCTEYLTLRMSKGARKGKPHAF